MQGLACFTCTIHFTPIHRKLSSGSESWAQMVCGHILSLIMIIPPLLCMHACTHTHTATQLSKVGTDNSYLLACLFMISLPLIICLLLLEMFFPTSIPHSSFLSIEGSILAELRSPRFIYHPILF